MNPKKNQEIPSDAGLNPVHAVSARDGQRPDDDQFRYAVNH